MKMMPGTYYHAKLISYIFPQRVEGKILDIGGRDGFFLTLCKAKEKIVLDLSPRETFPSIKYIKGDATNMNFKDNYFQRVFCFGTLEHIENRTQFFKEVIRVTRPGGKIFILVPYRNFRIMPPFLTAWVETNLWHHDKKLKLSERDFHDSLKLYRNKIQWKTIFVRNFFYRLFFLPLWYLWQISEPMGKIFMDQTLRLDKKMIYGGHGTLLVLIEKRR